MQVLHIDPTARRVSRLDVPRFDPASLLHTPPHNVAGAGLTNGRTPDVIFVARDTMGSTAPYFLISGLPMPIQGHAVIVGMAEEGHDSELGSYGKPLDAPGVTLEWLESNIVWLRLAETSNGMAAFEAVDCNPMTMINILGGFKDMQDKGDITLEGGFRDQPPAPVNLDHLIREVRGKLH